MHKSCNVFAIKFTEKPKRGKTKFSPQFSLEVRERMFSSIREREIAQERQHWGNWEPEVLIHAGSTSSFCVDGGCEGGVRVSQASSSLSSQTLTRLTEFIASLQAEDKEISLWVMLGEQQREYVSVYTEGELFGGKAMKQTHDHWNTMNSNLFIGADILAWHWRCRHLMSWVQLLSWILTPALR